MARPGEELVTTLIRLHEALKVTALPLALPGADKARASVRETVSQLEDYVLPRALQVEAPLLAVVGGSTGAGKSTLVNSIVGAVVTEAGVLRPTTRSPVLVHNPRDAQWFVEARVLPDFRRTSSSSSDPGALQLVASKNVPRGIALLDAPDVDSLEVQNRELATQLLAAADMWLFVTSAARYADNLPWLYLRQAADRQAAVAIVLDRTKPRVINEVAGHLTRMMVSRGLRDSPLFKVPEETLDADGLLPQGSVEQIQVWLEQLAADSDVRSAVIRQTLDGTIRSITTRTYAIADACAEQEKSSAELSDSLGEEFSRGVAGFDSARAAGTFTKGDVRRAWAGWRTVEAAAAGDRGRFRLRRARPERASEDRLVAAITEVLQTAVRADAASAIERVERRWRSNAAGKAILRGGGVSEVGLITGCIGAAEGWRGDSLEVAREASLPPRDTAALACALQVCALAADTESDPLGREAARLVQDAVGPVLAGRLIVRTRADLMRRVEGVMWDQQEQFVRRLAGQGLDGGNAERLRELARRVDDLRIMREDWQ